ncbi:THUMP domain-containing protein 3-like isoform X2 [Venturia canescens]|uniref:THUMP domain-containing protein 3-like isoform X2 n=1 Tax=Venturia canescens TaxID=32260 RepID=UPI001C9C4A90|nr:THUMP domain-containing protein 3-like isoform X2 [Venturia canescens]
MIITTLSLLEQQLTPNFEFFSHVYILVGLEWQAVDECRRKFHTGIYVVKERGKIYFNVMIDEFHKVQEMRSIDNIFIVADIREFIFTKNDKEADLAIIKSTVSNYMHLNKYLDAWKKTCRFTGKIYPTIEEWKEAVNHCQVAKEIIGQNSVLSKGRKRGCDPSLAKDKTVLSFRVTCERAGTHTFESSEVANAVGGELQDKYHWIVDLTMYHLEVVCKVMQDEMTLSLRVTHESKHRRNITHFGPTTLRATVCYNLLQLAQPKCGEIIIDPMCGGGSIPIEAALAFPDTYVMCGDNHDKAVDRTRMNIAALSERHKIDLLKWSIAKLPFKDSYIDVFVTDMPFGKRSGTMSDNRVVYKLYLMELARVVRLKYGRLVLLTYDRRSINVALQVSKDLFRVTKMLGVNMGGLNAVVYVLKRTNLTYEQFSTRKPVKSSVISNTREPKSGPEH